MSATVDPSAFQEYFEGTWEFPEIRGTFEGGYRGYVGFLGVM